MSTKQREPEKITVEALLAMGGPNLVYIRAAPSRELKGEIPEEVLKANDKFYSVHAADGTRVAVMNDREVAFIAARQHDMVPVSVH